MIVPQRPLVFGVSSNSNSPFRSAGLGQTRGEARKQPGKYRSSDHRGKFHAHIIHWQRVRFPACIGAAQQLERAVSREAAPGAVGSTGRTALEKFWAFIRTQPGLRSDGHKFFSTTTRLNRARR